MEIPYINESLDYFGIFVFAISGALVAGRKGFDIFGALVVALITCLGGGTLRDLAMNAHPLIWIENSTYLLVGAIAALATFILVKFRCIPMRTLEVCDAIGLAFFTIAGAQKALSYGYSFEICMLMGVMTGVAGGVLRDVICNDLPLVFHKEIYATAALSGAAAYLLVVDLDLANGVAIAVGMGVTLALRLAGIYRGWSLPAFMKVPKEL